MGKKGKAWAFYLCLPYVKLFMPKSAAEKECVGVVYKREEAPVFFLLALIDTYGIRLSLSTGKMNFRRLKDLPTVTKHLGYKWDNQESHGMFFGQSCWSQDALE